MLNRIATFVENNQANLTIVSILDKLPKKLSKDIRNISISELQEALVEKRLSHLISQISSIQKKLPIETKVLIGDPCKELIREVVTHKRDLIVKMVEKCAIVEKLFGCTDMCLLRKCPCPVWLMKSSSQGLFKNILATVDFEPSEKKLEKEELNRQILEMSTSMALSEFCELHIAHVWNVYGENSLRSELVHKQEADIRAYVDQIYTDHQYQLNKLVTEFIDTGGKQEVEYIKPLLHLPKGIVTDIIPSLVKDYKIDLIMMGTIGRTGIPGFLLGNTAETILSKLDCSVLTVKHKDFVTPISL